MLEALGCLLGMGFAIPAIGTYCFKCLDRLLSPWHRFERVLWEAEERYPVPADYEIEELRRRASVEFKSGPRISVWSERGKQVRLYWNEKGLFVWEYWGIFLPPSRFPPHDRRFRIPWSSFGDPYKVSWSLTARISCLFLIPSFQVALPVKDLNLAVRLEPRDYETISHLLPEAPSRAEEVEDPRDG